MTAMMDESDHQVDASLARKRRIELRSKQRRHDEEPSEKRLCSREESDEEYLPDDVPSGTRRKPSIRGVKKQARYDPGVPMTKHELVAWRKEARRVRNRESAAASRKKTRDTINALEAQVSILKSKYSAALERIVELEAKAAVETIAPSTLPQDASLVSPCASTTSSPQLDSTPTLSPEDNFTLTGEKVQDQEVALQHQHIIEMISRPNA